MRFFTDFAQHLSSVFRVSVLEPFLNMDIRDVLDILLLTAALFVFQRFYQKRRAGRVFLGMAVLVVIGTLAVVLELPALTYLSRLVADCAVFCMIVIFSPEIRDGLEALGNTTMLNPGSNTLPVKKYSLARRVAEESADAVFAMAAEKTGALIIYEGLTGLGDYTKSGKLLDATLSSPLLQNLFFENAPLHDGAVVVRDFRIYAAGCVLPSSKGKISFGTMGMRHRAAVGVTEVSDALAVVVSEQTGTVSVANTGRLLRGIDREDLVEILMIFLAGNAYLTKRKRVVGDKKTSALRDLFNKAEKKAEDAAKNGEGGK